jgi:hypothetical protein
LGIIKFSTQKKIIRLKKGYKMATPTAAQHMSQRHQQLQQQQQQQQNQSSREADLSAQAALNIEDTPPVHIVQIVPLVQLLLLPLS